MAGMIGIKNLPFKVGPLITQYKQDKKHHKIDAPHLYGADEYFLTDYFMPELYKFEPKILIHIEPRCKGKVEIFPDQEDYRYYTIDYQDMG